MLGLYGKPTCIFVENPLYLTISVGLILGSLIWIIGSNRVQSNNPSEPSLLIKGVSCALVSTALFVIVSVIVRSLSDSFTAMQMLSARQWVFILLLMPVMARQRQSLLKPQRVTVHLLRICGAFVALYGGYVAVSNLPLADATALGFLQVLFVAMIASTLLNERLTASRWFTIVAGFIGVMLVVRPSFNSSETLYIAIGVLAAIGAAVAVVCVRALSKVEFRTNLLAYQALAVGALATLLSFHQWTMPSIEQMGLLLLVGVLSSIAQWFGVTAYKFAQANVVANIEYVKILYSIGLGYWIFAESPDSITLVGASFILLSALLPSVWQRLFIKDRKCAQSLN